jgi:ribonuclease BN (tRNA processing enzyme)
MSSTEAVPAEQQLTVTVLGCSGTYAGAGGACSGYLLRTATTNLWVDCGPGTLANVQEHLDLTDLHGLVITHAHPDHWMELPVLVNALRYGVGAPDLGIPLLWTARTAEIMSRVGPEVMAPTFHPRVIDERSTATIGDIELRFSRTDHPVETLAVRADHGPWSIAYSADTGDDWELSSLGPGIDLAVVEASLDESDAGVVQHLTGSEAGRQAAGAGALLLTHVLPGGDVEERRTAAARAYDGPIAVAQINRTYLAGEPPT